MAFRGRAKRDQSLPRGRRPPAMAPNGAARWASAGLTALLLAGGFHNRSAPRRPADDPGRAPLRDHGRGRSARTPSDIPAPGWKDVLLRVFHNISEDRVLAIAAGVAYYIILAIFPALAALVAVYGLFADPSSINSVLDSLSSAMPSGVVDVIGNQLHSLTSQPSTSLGVTFLVSVLISLWSANSGVQAIFDSLNVVYHEREKRSFPKLYGESLLFTIGALVSGVVGLALVAVLPPALAHLGGEFGISGPMATIISVGRWPILLVIVAVSIAVLYRYGPSRERPRWRWVSWGSAAASLLWLGASLLFSWYTANFGSYNKTYGSLAAAVIFMTWLWISVIVVLIGAELDAEMEHQTARDTTTGRPEPLGRRGAYVADTVGPAQG